MSTKFPRNSSVAEAQLHGELVFAVFKLDHIAVFLDDSPVLAPECQVRCANSKGRQKKMTHAGSIRFNADRKRGHHGNETKSIQHADGEVRLLSRRFAGEGNDRDMQEEDIG